MQRILVAFFALAALLCLGLSVVSARRTSPSDNVPSPIDQCTNTFSCPPTAVPGGAHSGDEDGDGIPDGIDQCPNEGGPASNQGCPVGTNLSDASGASAVITPTLPIVLPPPLPPSGNCVLATKTAQGVNVHNQPALSSTIVGVLDPQVTYLVISALQTPQGLWYDVIPGWVSKAAVRVSASCSQIPVSQSPTITNSTPTLVRANGYGISLDKGNSPGQDTDHGYCSSSFALNFSKLDGSGSPLHFEFGDGSVHFNFGCIQLDSDGQGFSFLPPGPCDTGQVALSCAPVMVHGTFGLIDGQLNFLVAFSPASPGGEPPPDPDHAPLFFVWRLVPPDPCAQGGACGNPGDVRSYGIDWSEGNAATPGLAFSWTLLPPDPCKPGDQSCPGQGGAQGGRQGVLVNFLPAVQDNTAPNVMTYWFPNGFDPNAGGFTLIENHLNNLQPGDKYGFTLIENQPLTGGVTIQY